MIGTTISHYRIVEKLGQGGMGVVYRAEDLNLPRDVALKFLPQSLCGDEDALSRFLHEAQAISKLNHPNIATIYSLEDAGEQRFIALEYLPGGTLAGKLKAGPLSIEEALEYAIQIAEGLSHAHQNSIVHRDLKTENVLLTAEGRVKITDFGLAKSGEGSRLTRAGYTIGTAAYMSPEQARGEEVDQRSDIFSFGIVFYELLSGGLPFKGVHEAALLYEIVNEQPGQLRDVRADVPALLERIVGRAMEKNPDRRYQSAIELLADLREARTMAEKGFPSDRSLRLPRLGRKWLWVGLILIVIPLVTFLLKDYQVTITQQEIPSLAVLHIKNLGPASDESYAYGFVQDVIVDIAKAGVIRVAPMKDVLSLQDERLPIGQIARRLNVRYVLDGTLRREGDMFQLSAQIVDAGSGTTVWADRIQRTVREASTLQGRLTQSIITALNLKPSETVARDITTPKTGNPDAYEYYLRATYLFRHKKNRSDVETSRGMFEKAVELDSSFISSWIGLGLVCESLGQYSDADSMYGAGLGIARERHDSLGMANCSSRLGVVAMNTSAYAEAENYCSVALEMFMRLGDLSGETAVLNNLGALNSYKGDHAKALEYYSRALKTVRLIDDRPEESRLLGNIGISYQDKGDYDLALDAFSMALDIKLNSGDRRGEGVMLECLGNLQLELGNFNAAESLLSRALPVHREIGNRAYEGSVLCSLGELCAIRRYSGKATANYEQALTVLREIGDRQWTGMVLTKLGALHNESNHFHAATETLTEAVRIFNELGDRPYLMLATSELALAEVGLGNQRKCGELLDNVAREFPMLIPGTISIQIAWNTYRGFYLLGRGEEGVPFLRAAHDQVSDRASRIASVPVRERFLSMVPRNRDILRLWKDLAASLK
jgi:serine/threonine protein kinase/Tfp pilus assembly protein PilF